MNDASFAQLFGGDALLAISGGPSATLEPVLLRSTAKRDALLAARRDRRRGRRTDELQRRGCPGHRGAGEAVAWRVRRVT